jgi:hypothetical protein
MRRKNSSKADGEAWSGALPRRARLRPRAYLSNVTHHVELAMTLCALDSHHASIDVDARRTFREELRGRRVALRSFIPRDDIDDIEIVEAEDPEVSATRQVLKVEAVDRTGEIDAVDVLESIDIVQACAPREVVAPVVARVTETAPLPIVGRRTEERGGYAALDVEDDAFFAHNDPPSTGGVTFHLGDCYVDEAGPTIELHGAAPVDRRRRLAWIVGTVLACAVVMTAAAAITEHAQTDSSESVTNASPSTPPIAPTVSAVTAPTTLSGPRVTLTPATTTAYPAIPEMDVGSLPAALAGTIVGIPKRPLFVDGHRLQSSTAIVACGKHSVKSGSRAAHVIDVPCGGSIALK